MQNVVEFEGREITYPGSWDTMTLKHLKSVATLLLQGLKPDDFKMKLVLKFMNLEKNIFSWNDRTYYIYGIYKLWLPIALWGIKHSKVKSFDYSDAYLLSETMNFLLSEKEMPDGTIKVERNNLLLKQLLPYIKAGRDRLYGPGDRMNNITAGEFAKAETRYQSFLNTHDEKYLNEMIAVLYRPRKKFVWLLKYLRIWGGESRVPYHDYHLARAKEIGHIDLVTRFCILLHFEGCRNYAVNKYPEVFSGDGDDDGDSSGWAGIFQAISDKPTEIEQIAQLNFWTLIFDLKQKAIHAEKLKSKNPEE